MAVSESEQVRTFKSLPEREREKRDARQRAEIRMLRRELEHARTRIDVLEMELAACEILEKPTL
jgi:hypothetical protein